jgi:hypothetical protein
MLLLIQYRVLKHLGKSTMNEGGRESGITADRIKVLYAKSPAIPMLTGDFTFN